MRVPGSESRRLRWRALTSPGWGLVKSSTAEQQTEGVKLLQGGSAGTSTSTSASTISPSSSASTLPGPDTSRTNAMSFSSAGTGGRGTSPSHPRGTTHRAHTA